MTRLVTASATHVGQIRDINQDRSLVTATLGAVADGMGGHVGGEKAAALAIAELGGVRGVISSERLVDVARAANHRVFEASQAPELRGMGTTLVIATFDPEGSVVSIANIGDSRGYLFRDGVYEQITLDHSLVEELLRQGRLTEEEARDHPQRNMVTRALGIGPDIEVDLFNIVGRPGDRFVLCSDGLSNEVDDDAVAAILSEHHEAATAAQALVDTAVANGGRDNVTVVILDLVPDGDDAATGTDTPTLVDTPAVVDRPTVVDTAEVNDEPEPHADSNGSPKAVDPLADLEDLPQTSDPQRFRDSNAADSFSDGQRPARRGLPSRGVLSVLAVMIVLAAAATATYFYDRSAWFVSTVDGEVAIFRGRPGGGVLFDPVVVEETGTDVESLNPASQQRIEKESVFSSIEAAQQLVASLEPAGQTVTTTVPPTTNSTD